jgi:hypothetical protein
MSSAGMSRALADRDESTSVVAVQIEAQYLHLVFPHGVLINCFVQRPNVKAHDGNIDASQLINLTLPILSDSHNH